MKPTFVWNKEKTECVDLYKIRSIAICKERMGQNDYIAVRGWFNEREHFDFGTFDNEKEAQNFINAIWE